MHVAPFQGPQGLSAIVENNDGSFRPYVWANTVWYSEIPLPGANAIGGKGLSVVYNGHSTYVFEIENSGLWFTKLRAGQSSWDGWCNVSSSPRLDSAPSAVYLGDGYGFQVVSYTLDRTLAIWHLETDDSSPSCGYEWTVPSPPPQITGSPVAVSWGPDRYDVFATTYPGANLVHFWSSNDPFITPSDETLFSINGGSRQFQLSETSGDLAAATLGNLSLGAAFRESSGAVEQLFYSAAGWQLAPTVAGSEAIVDVSTYWHGTPDCGDGGFQFVSTVCNAGTTSCEDLSSSGAALANYSSVAAIREVRGITVPGCAAGHIALAIDGTSQLYWTEQTL
jgi:hypothetical protein